MYYLTMHAFRHVFADVHRVVQSPFAVNVVGHRQPLDHVYRAPAGRPIWLQVFFHTRAAALLAGRTEHFGPNTLIVFPPGVPLRYESWAGSTHSWVNCSGTRVPKLLRDAGLPVCRPLTVPDPALFERYALALQAELGQATGPDERILLNLFENWTIETKRAYERRGVHRIDPVFVAIRDTLAADYAQSTTLAELAARAGLSVSHFCLKFKRYFGVAPIEFLIRTRLRQAASLLHDHGLKIHEVARRVGIEDVYYFSKLFKKRYGTSPTGYRLRATV